MKRYFAAATATLALGALTVSLANASNDIDKTRAAAPEANPALSYSALDQGWSPSDQLSDTATEELEGRAAGRFGLTAADARLLAARDGERWYLASNAATSDTSCVLVTTDDRSRRSTVCAANEAIVSSPMVGVGRSVDGFVITGVAPDAVRSVTIGLADGTSQAVDVHDNTIKMSTTLLPRTLSYTSSTGEDVSLALYAPPANGG